MSSVDVFDAGDGDLGLVNANDEHSVFLMSPERHLRRLPSLSALENRTRRPSSSFVATASAECLDEIEKSKPRRPSLHHLSRSQTLPKSYVRSPVREKEFTPGTLDASVSDDVVARLRRWILCVLVVNFDLDQGPVINGVFPPFPMSTSEKENICFSSIPDSFRYDEGAEAHTFRIRESTLEGKERQALQQFQDGFLYGFSYFQRKRDEYSSRGYDQRSMIILTHYPWPALYLELVNKLGPMFLAHDGPMLESACHNIASWPPPDPGTTLELGFLGSVLTVELPAAVDSQQAAKNLTITEKLVSQPVIHASSTPSIPPPLHLFAPSISHLWSIWECLLLGEPILVFGPTPAVTSQTIWWFLDVMKPVPIAGDYRPYFTVHDEDYHSLINKNPPKAGVLLGVTNPLFDTMCKHWPHKLSVGSSATPSSKRSSKAHLIAGPAPGWQTKTHNRYISKDRDLLKQLEHAIKTDGPLDVDGRLSHQLQQHFSTRAVQFLVPLNRYLNTLIPSPTESSQSISSVESLPCRPRALKPFNRDQFFALLKVHGSPLPFRSSSKQREFYERWLRTPAFGLWMARQEEAINKYL